VVRHPDYGRRTLCFGHAQDLLHKPPKGEQREARSPSDSEGTEGPGPTAPERVDRPEAGACPPTRKASRQRDRRDRPRDCGAVAGWSR